MGAFCIWESKIPFKTASSTTGQRPNTSKNENWNKEGNSLVSFYWQIIQTRKNGFHFQELVFKVLQSHCRSSSKKQLTHILFSKATGIQRLNTEAVNTDKSYARPHPFSCCHLTVGISFCHLCRAERDSVVLKLCWPLETLLYCPVLLQHSIFWCILVYSGIFWYILVNS